jgi:YHS domain-containing protein
MIRIILLAVSLALLVPAAAFAKDPVNESFLGVAIDGADPVAYFDESRHVEGSSDYEVEWQGATWRFANADRRDRFQAEPEKYAPQFGGYCAWAVSQGYTAPIDPEAFSIVDGKLYLNYDEDIQAKWRKDQAALIAAAEKNWPAVHTK